MSQWGNSEFNFTEMFMEKSFTFHMAFVTIAEFDWLPGRLKGQILEKIFFSETIRWKKLKRFMQVKNIILYMNYVAFLLGKNCPLVNHYRY